MFINGKEVFENSKSASNFQQKINTVEQLPDSAKSEVSPKDSREMFEDFFGTESYNTMTTNNNTLLTGGRQTRNREDYYNLWQEMDEKVWIDNGLTQIADDCTQSDDFGHILNIESDDDEISKDLQELFRERLNIDDELWSIFYEVEKMGDCFYEIIPDSYEKPTKIARMRYLDPKRVNRIEKDGRLVFYTYYSDAFDPEKAAFNLDTIKDKKRDEKILLKLEPWQIVHFKIENKDFAPYGGSLLKAGASAFEKLKLLENGLVVYRLARTPERRVFNIDCGNRSEREKEKYLRRVRDNYRSDQIVDNKGNINKVAAALSLTQDFFIAKGENGSGTTIDTLSGGTGNNNIDDVKYFKDEILATLHIPPEYNNGQTDQASGRGSLAMKDIKFARFCERIQKNVEKGLYKIASIELFFNRKKKEDLKNFKLKLKAPSNVKEIMDLEYLLNKMNLIQSMLSTNVFSRSYVLRFVLKISEREANNLLFLKDAENMSMQAQNDGMGAVAIPSTDAAPSAGGEQPVVASVKTENIENKLISIFGKDFILQEKEDFSKLVEASKNFEKELRKSNEFKNSVATANKVIEELLTRKDNDRKNLKALSLINENELGGLDFKNSSYKVYAKPRKKTGPKTDDPFIIEEITRSFKK